MADAAAGVVLRSIPGLMPLAGMSLGFIALGIAGLLVWIALVAALPEFRESVNDDNQNVLLVYTPALGWLFGALGTLVDQTANVIQALASLAASSILSIVFLFVAAAAAFLFLAYQAPAMEGTGELYTCEVYPNAVAPIFSVLNTLDLFIATGLPVVNFVNVRFRFPLHRLMNQVQFWSQFGIIRRVLIDCSIAGGWRSLTDFFVAFAAGLTATAKCITDYLGGGALLTARIDFVPGLTLLLGSFEKLAFVYDCVCNYLSFFWDDLFGLPSQPSLITSLDCAGNFWLRLIQMVGFSISNLTLPNFAPPTEEFQCAEISFGVWIEDVAAFFGTTFIDFLFLIPETVSSNVYDAQLLLPTRVTVTRSGGIYASTEGVDSRLLMAEILANSNPQWVGIAAINFSAPWNWTAIAAYFVSILETPWSRVITFPIAGIAAGLNGTASVFSGLSPLATNNSAISFTDIQFFQVGYILDWFRGAAVALGVISATITTLPELAPVISGLIYFPIGWAQIALELARDFFFMNYFYPAASGDPFQAWTDYCNSNSSQWALNYALLYNNSAALGILLGCNESLSQVPMSSPLATCTDSVLGGLGMNPYRLIGETFQYPVTIICNLPMLLLFKPPLFYSPPPPQIYANPSNPPLLNWGNMSLDAWARQWLNTGVAIQNLFYFLDQNADAGGYPTGVDCVYDDPSSPTLIGYKISPWCSFGNGIDVLFDLVGSLIYPFITMINKGLGAVAVPELSSQVQLPAFGDTLRDATVFGCIFFQFIGSWIPATFTCSAQAGSSGNVVFGYPVQPPPQLAGHPPVTNLTSRTNAAANTSLEVHHFCFYSATQWATTGLACNCTNITAFYSPLGATPAPCLVRCLIPSITFPYVVGFNNTLSINCSLAFTNSIPMVTTIFSNFTTLQAFLGSAFPPVPAEPNPSNLDWVPYPAVNPTNTTSPVYRPSAFMQQLVTAQLNDYFNEIYQPQFILRVNASAEARCTSFSNIFTPEVDFFNTVMPNFVLNQLTMHDFINIVTYIYYGQASALLVSPADAAALAECNLPRLYGTSPQYSDNPIAFGPNVWADVLLAWRVQHGFDATARVLLDFLTVYNAANTGCQEANPQPWQTFCFVAGRIPTTTAPVIVSPTAEIPANPGTICTYLPSQYLVLAPGSCNCSQPDGFYYGVGTADCLFYCESPFPFTLGPRNDNCLRPSACANSGQEINNVSISNYYIATASLLDPIAPFGNDQPPLSYDLQPGYFLSLLYAARLNLHYIQRHRPGLYVYVRPITDQFLNATCLGYNVRAPAIFAGMEMSVVLNVLDTLWLGNHNTPRTCDGLFRHGAPASMLCARLLTYAGLLIIPGNNLPYSANTSSLIVPLLESFNFWQRTCTLNVSCFVTTTFNAANKQLVAPARVSTQLNFTSPIYYTLQTVPIAQMEPCPELIPCFTTAGCDTVAVVTAALGLVSNTVQEVNEEISGLGGNWTLGQSVWEILTTTLNQVIPPALRAIVSDLSLLDCFICAITGDVPFDVNDQRTWPCAASLFSFSKPIAVLLNDVSPTLVGITVDTARFIVDQTYFFFSGQFGQWALGVVRYIIDIFSNVIIPLVDEFYKYIFSIICGCTAWNAFASTKNQCTNAAWCSILRRHVEWMAATFLALHMYQAFAPDWPNSARYSWPPEDACAIPMAAYAQQAPNLTDAKADEVAYCLARLVLFPYNASEYYIRSASSNVLPQFDECSYVMQHYPPTQAFGALSPRDRAFALSCVQARGNVYGFKQATGGMLDWVPDHMLTHAANPAATWLPLLHMSIDSYRVHAERANDMSYTDAVLNSHEYEAELMGTYGRERVALMQLARTNLIAPIEDYTAAVLSASNGTRKRADTPIESAYMARVTSLAEFIGVVTTTLGDSLVPNMISRWRDQSTATLPPIYQAFDRDGVRTATATTRAMANETFSPDTSGPIGSERMQYTIRGRTVNSIASLMRAANAIMPEEPTVVLAGSASNPILNVRNTIPRHTDDSTLVLTRRRFTSSTAAAVATRNTHRRPGLLTIFYHGIRAGVSATRDILTGHAFANATSTANTASFNWRLTRLPEAVNLTAPGFFTRSKNVVATLFGTAVAGPMQRYQTVWNSVWQLMARDRRSDERIRRIQVTGQAIRNTLGVILWQEPLGRTAKPGTSSMKRAFTTSNATIPAEFCYNITTVEFCQQCFYLNQYFGYTALAGRQLTWYYNTTANETGPFSTADVSNVTLPPWGPNPQLQNSQAYAYKTFVFINDYLTNITSTPLVVGKSAALPARFPNIAYSVWDYLDDTVQNKTAFTAWEPLFNATWVFIKQLLSNIDLLAPSQWALAATDMITTTRIARRHVTIKRALQDKPAIRARHLPTPLSAGAAEFTLDRLFVRTVMQTFRIQPQTRTPTQRVAMGNRLVVQSEFRTAAYDTLADILEGWALLIWDEFIYCRYDSELDATNVRYSLLQAAFFAAIPAILVGVAIASLPTLLMPVVVLTAPVWATVGVWVSIGVWIGFATGWKVLCFPTLPTILFATMGMQALTTSLVANKCPMWFSGLVREAAYDNTNCMVCENWRNGTFTILSCQDELGWNGPFDVPVFWLKACQGTNYFCSGWLAYIQNPANFAAFFAALIATPLVQEWLHRWDNVDLSDPIGYSSQYQCAFWLIGIWLVLSVLIGQLFSIGPAWQTIKWFLALFNVVMQVAILFLFGFFVVLYAAFHAPMELIKRATARKRGVSIESLDFD